MKSKIEILLFVNAAATVNPVCSEEAITPQTLVYSNNDGKGQRALH